MACLCVVNRMMVEDRDTYLTAIEKSGQQSKLWLACCITELSADICRRSIHRLICCPTGQMLRSKVLKVCFSLQTHKCFNELVESILSLLHKDVPDNVKSCTQYFWLLSMYAAMVSHVI